MYKLRWNVTTKQRRNVFLIVNLFQVKKLFRRGSAHRCCARLWSSGFVNRSSESVYRHRELQRSEHHRPPPSGPRIWGRREARLQRTATKNRCKEPPRMNRSSPSLRETHFGREVGCLVTKGNSSGLGDPRPDDHPSARATKSPI